MIIDSIILTSSDYDLHKVYRNIPRLKIIHGTENVTLSIVTVEPRRIKKVHEI